MRHRRLDKETPDRKKSAKKRLLAERIKAYTPVVGSLNSSVT